MPGKVLTINRTCADFTVGVQHLTTTETGAYNLICDTIVTHGQDSDPPSLPDDDTLLANVTKCSVRDWRRMKPRLCSGPLAVLILEDGRLSQARVVEEIENARQRMDAGAKAGRASGEARRRKSTLLRERMLNGRSEAQAAEGNGNTTDVERSFKGSERTKRTDREPVMSHESRRGFTPKEERESSTTARGRAKPNGNGDLPSLAAFTTQAFKIAQWTEKQPAQSGESFEAAFEAKFELPWSVWCETKRRMEAASAAENV